jgi:hypothetical protein
MPKPKPDPNRCAGCGVKIEPGHVLCDSCFDEWQRREGKKDGRRDK